jgi:hypothetical protein
MRDLLSDRDAATRMGLAARHTAETHLNWSLFEDRLFRILEEALSAPRSS